MALMVPVVDHMNMNKSISISISIRNLEVMQLYGDIKRI
jgi:hypothetical protein